jgi:hypothetical protein
MLKPICVKCQRFYRPHRTGRRFVEGMPILTPPRARPGKDHPEEWQPYKVWQGDEWICHGCGSLIIVGVGFNPVSERHHDNFDEYVATASYLRVNDC